MIDKKIKHFPLKIAYLDLCRGVTIRCRGVTIRTSNLSYYKGAFVIRLLERIISYIPQDKGA